MKTEGWGNTVLVWLALFQFPGLSFASPRPPLPPLPELAPLLSRADFDEPFWARTLKPESFHPAYADLVESWSGYALRRSGESVTPFLMLALYAGGHTNVGCASGAVRFWFKPDWSTASLTNATGPGVPARLLELTAVGAKDAVVIWSLNANTDGTALYLTGAANNGPVDLLTAPVEWQAGQWHLLALNYGPKGSSLLIDGELAAEGSGVQTAPQDVSALSVGSTLIGRDPAGGEFDEVCAFARPLTPAEARFCYQLYAPTAALGPITAEEYAARREASAKWRAAQPAQQDRMMQPSSGCDTNGPVRLTNMVCKLSTNEGWTVTFEIMGGTNGVLYDIFTTTNLAGTNISDSRWTWLDRGPTCYTYVYTNQPPTQRFYVLGLPLDSDGDGLTDAYEQLVSKTDPTVGVNRIQSENAITGTTNWQLFNPITLPLTIPADTNLNPYSRSWPTNDADTTPEIEGFGSATSVNVSGVIDLYVDVRNGDANFTVEVYRLGWYGGLGGRKMIWDDNGPKSSITLPSRKQPIPAINPTNGLIDCTLPCLTNGVPNSNFVWRSSYTLTIPPDWVSGVYVAKLTTGTNVTPQTTGRQSYIIFVVREDTRSSDFLFQTSMTTYQAYNPWGGRSLYADIPIEAPLATNVSFNRPFGFYSGCGSATTGIGAGDFLTLQCGQASWEYNMVRWLERQGYDVTYSTSIDTHRTWPTNKTIKAFLSVGHDEYWSSQMRTNVETARDQGVNLAFFAANVCFWQIHFDDGVRVFSVDKAPASGAYDLWRGTVVNNPEISMTGVEFVLVVSGDMKMPNSLPAHWAYDYTGLTNGQILPGLLGYEVDGCWEIFSDPPCPQSATAILASSPFSYTTGPNTFFGHSYMTIYTNASGTQVFATGSMQWNWGLDDFGSESSPSGTSHVHNGVQQMTHNVLRTFSRRTNTPAIFVNAETATSGNWPGVYGSNGYVIAAALTNMPSFVQVTITNQLVQVWGDPTNEVRALLKPGSTNRIAAAWTTTDSQNSKFTIDLNFTDTLIHQVALYCVDWLGTGTTLANLEVFDSNDTTFSNTLDTRNFILPPNGVYLVWKLNGHKIIRVTKPDAKTGNKALVSALFFDPSP